MIARNTEIECDKCNGTLIETEEEIRIYYEDDDIELYTVKTIYLCNECSRKVYDLETFARQCKVREEYSKVIEQLHAGQSKKIEKLYDKIGYVKVENAAEYLLENHLKDIKKLSEENIFELVDRITP